MKKLLFSTILAMIVLLVVEAGSWAAIRVLYMKHYLTGPPMKATGAIDYAHRRRIRHEVLGWPLKEGEEVPGGAYRDRTGARRLPAFPDPAIDQTCVSLYGDSFVQGVRVDAEHTWANRLARTLGCRISNYGQAGYGTDQALLLHRLNLQDKAPIVILGHMHEDVERTLTRIRDLITGGRDWDVKPRFVLDSHGELVLVPMPDLTEEQYERVVGLRSPALPLEYENFQPGGPLVAPRDGFPYIVSLIRALSDYRVRARLRANRPIYAELYEPGNVTHGLELMVALARKFREETERRGQDGLMVFLPPRDVLSYYMRTDKWIHQPLVDRMKQEKIPYMDFGPYLMKHGNGVLNKVFATDGHYNATGEALLASMVATELADRHLVGPLQKAERRDPAVAPSLPIAVPKGEGDTNSSVVRRALTEGRTTVGRTASSRQPPRAGKRARALR